MCAACTYCTFEYTYIEKVGITPHTECLVYLTEADRLPALRWAGALGHVSGPDVHPMIAAAAVELARVAVFEPVM